LIQQHGGTHIYNGVNHLGGTIADEFVVYTMMTNLGDLATIELQQPVVSVCSNTLYRFVAFQALSSGPGGANGRCVVTLKVNGVEVATGLVTTITASTTSSWSPATGYYLTGPAETAVSVQVLRSCYGDSAGSGTFNSWLDDITFTPVSP
jgi:hypothetical protein